MHHLANDKLKAVRLTQIPRVVQVTEPDANYSLALFEFDLGLLVVCVLLPLLKHNFVFG